MRCVSGPARPRGGTLLGRLARLACVAWACAAFACSNVSKYTKPSEAELRSVVYQPLVRDDWRVSTPAEQGLDPRLVGTLYYNAPRLETLYGLLVIKNGYLVAEGYFNNGSVDQRGNMQSVTKSFTSALVGIALDKGYLRSLDQKMIEFFPELAGRIQDPRKKQIMIRHLLQMRAGYPWEESSVELFELLYHGFKPSNLVDVPLNKDPGSGFEYSNLTSHLLGVIVARASGTDLRSLAERHLFSKLHINAGFWQKDWEGNYLGFAVLHLTARDMARFGLMYLNGGRFDGQQVVSERWVRDSLLVYSEDAWGYAVGPNFKDIGYGYQWWSVRAGEHHYHLAWGHGGQQIALLPEYDMVIVATADPLQSQHGGGPWDLERSNLNLVANFIASL
jgi:CubicO group peptidase (beta-lactamase class C family)